MTLRRGLYPIVDLDTLSQRDISPLRFAEAVLTARPPLLQLRAKRQAPREVLSLLGELQPLCERAGTLLFANDRPDLALLAGTSGVHVGQDDVPLRDVRRLPGSLRVGVSTHDHEQLAAALDEKPDYAAFGPIFATRSKQGAEPALGLSALGRAAELAHAAQVPLVAIGGLTLEEAAELGRLGVIAAVISDLLAGGDAPSAIAERANAWQRALG
ncbi:MAG: thiamine-phosphate diphosphorylase [Polyangiaceae bacterium]|jgi:thiamine-phosphate pyrophosphorylase|nr:thiamine-phosphate diphosphorylase [Polyangiaceae bacterium]